MNKKFIILAAMAAVFGMSFTACSNDDETPAVKGGNQPAMTRAISFVNYMDNAPTTRGLAASLGDIQTDGMSVWAFDATKETAINNEGGQYFMGGYSTGLAHTWDGTNNWFKAAADYFWPEYALNFVALTPQSGGGIGAITVSQAAKVGDDLQKPVMNVAIDVPLTTESDGVYGSDTQKDIMFASIEGQAPLASGSAALSFKHGLSQLVFKGVIDHNTTIHKAVVKSIQLVNVASDGTLTYTAATDNIAASNWGTQNKRYAANIVNNTVTALDNSGSADAISGYDNNNTVTPVEPSDPGVRDYQMMIIPQTSVACTDDGHTDNLSQLATPTTGTYLLVKADLYANGNDVDKVVSNTTNVYIPLESTTWEANTKYTYTLKFGDNLLHPITFTASIADWTNAAKNVEY